jgi:hypothetical protein
MQNCYIIARRYGIELYKTKGMMQKILLTDR